MPVTAAWLVALAVLGLLVGLLMMAVGIGMRRRRGLGGGRTVALDSVTLVSKRLGLLSRPDRLVKASGVITPEEWKSAAKVWPNHRVQIGLDFKLIEEKWGIRPSHGFIVTGDGMRHRVENTGELQAWVLDVAEQIRRQEGRRRGLVSASEMASWVFSPEQWRREYVLGEKPKNLAEIKAGKRHHGRKAMAERVAGGSIGVGQVVMLLSVLGLVLLWLAKR
jgi:CRISPR-associated exonuclease Cas4